MPTGARLVAGFVVAVARRDPPSAIAKLVRFAFGHNEHPLMVADRVAAPPAYVYLLHRISVEGCMPDALGGRPPAGLGELRDALGVSLVELAKAVQDAE